MLSFGNELLEQRARPEQRFIGVLLGPALDNELGGVQTNVVGQFWNTFDVTETILHIRRSYLCIKTTKILINFDR